MAEQVNKFFQGFKHFFASRATFIVTALIILLVLKVFIPQLDNLMDSVKAIRDADKTLLLWAIVVFTLGFPVLAAKYCTLAQFKLQYGLTLQVQIAAAFIIKLLPVSVGSLTVNTFYLTKVSKNITKAASTMTLNAVTSSVAFTLIILTALITSQVNPSAHSPQKDIDWEHILSVIVILLVILGLVLLIRPVHRRLTAAVSSLWGQFKQYKNEPGKVFYGIILNALGSLTGIMALYICTHAVGLDVQFPEAVLSYTLGNVVGSLVPTPGGLGGAEAGLYAGLVFFGYDPGQSLTAVLLYRLVSYWLPIIPGFLMYRHLRHTILRGFHIKKTA